MVCSFGPQIQLNLVKSKSSRLEVLFQIISSLNYGEVEITYFKPKNYYYQVFSLSNLCFGCVKETSQGDVSYTSPQHMFFIDSY